MFEELDNYNLVIAIPTYKRYQIIQQKTLPLLERNHIPIELIHLFVADQNEYELYAFYLPVKYHQNIHIGRIGCEGQRRYITSFFPIGQHIVYMDDDIEHIDLSLLTESLTLLEFLVYAFDFTIERKSFIWGVYPVYNPYYREKKQMQYTTCLNFILGCFFGIINRGDCDYLRRSIENKGDVEMSIQYFIHDRIVIRFERVGVKNQFYSAGGIGSFADRLQPSMIEVDYLVDTYPEYGKKTIRDNGMAEFKLHKIVANPINIETIPIEYRTIYTMLENVTFPKSGKNSTRTNFPMGNMSMQFGITNYKYAHKIDEAYYSKKYPTIHNELMKLATIIGVKHPIVTIHVNKNVICPPHYDIKNSGVSTIVAIGNYTGCDLLIENEIIDCHYKPIEFDGVHKKHWNSNDLVGTRYSIVYY